MPKLWIKRITATLGCLLLFAGTMACSQLLLSRSWRDLDDANVRMQVFRHHVFDWDFIWSAVAFGTNVVLVLSLFLFSFWMFWLLITRWDMRPSRQQDRP